MKRNVCAVLALIVVAYMSPVQGAETRRVQTLDTPHYVVTIESLCREGEVTCDQIRYEGVSKRSGNSIRLIGHTLFSLCADKVTPCRFLGYQFRNGNVTYQILEPGILRVIQDQSIVLINEQGRWLP